MHYTKANGGALDGAVSVISINGSQEYQVGRDASSSEAGIAKLYDTVPTTGGATDGAVTQQAVVNAITDVKTNIEDNELVVASALNDLDSRINNMPIIPFVEEVSGVAGTTSTNRTQWTGTVDGITELYNGLPILIKVPMAGVAAGITLDINNLGEHPVILNASTLATTHYAVGCIIMLVYDSFQTVTLKVNGTNTSFGGCWKISDYNTNTTYGEGTLAQLQAGTSGTNRLWPATVLHNYINSTVIDGSRISGTMGSSYSVNFGSLCSFSGLGGSVIPGQAINLSGISTGAIPGYTIGGWIGTGSDTVYLGSNVNLSNVNFSNLHYGVIPGYAVAYSGLSGSVIPGRAIDFTSVDSEVIPGSAISFSGVKNGEIPANKIASGYPGSSLSAPIPASLITGSLYSTITLYNAALGHDLATGNSLQYIDYPYDQYQPTTTVLSNMLKDINALKATLEELNTTNYDDLVDGGFYAVRGTFGGVENPIVRLWYSTDDEEFKVNICVDRDETVIYNYVDHIIGSVNNSGTMMLDCLDEVVSQLDQIYNHSFSADGTYNYSSSMRVLGIIG